MKDILITALPYAMGLLFLSRGVPLVVRRVSAKRTGMKLQATVAPENTRRDGRGFQSYLATVRFQTPDGNWVQQSAQATTARSRLGKAVSVWYTPGKRIWVDDPGFTGKVVLLFGGGLFALSVGSLLAH